MQFHHDYLQEHLSEHAEDITLMYLGGADLIERHRTHHRTQHNTHDTHETHGAHVTYDTTRMTNHRCGPVFGVELDDGKLAPVVAVGRPGYTEALRTMVQSSIRYAEKHGLQASRDMLYIVSNETLAFSSTKVRRLLVVVARIDGLTRHTT